MPRSASTDVGNILLCLTLLISDFSSNIHVYSVLSVTSHINCIAERCLINSVVPLSCHDDVALFEWRCKWRWINTKIENCVIISSLKSKTMRKLINKIPGSRIWYQIYQARLWERMLNRSASLGMSTSVLKALPGKLDIKRHSPSILYFSEYMGIYQTEIRCVSLAPRWWHWYPTVLQASRTHGRRQNTEIERIPEGRLLKRIPEGRLLKRIPEGRLLKRIPEGRLLKRIPEGRLLKRIPEGRLLKRIPEGRLLKRIPEGRLLKRGVILINYVPFL